MEMFKKEEVEKYYDFLGHKGITEIRVCKPQWDSSILPISHFVKCVKDFIEVCEKYNGKWNVYCGINERKVEGKSDKDVEYITCIGHDIDAHKNKEGFIVAGQGLEFQELY